jgi:hypothetical protein
MTLIEIRNQIFTHFLKSDTFALPNDLKKVKVGKNQEEFKQELVTQVLTDMQEDGLCGEISNPATGEIKAFVMAGPLGQNGQDVSISNQTAELVAEIINQYLASQDQEGVVDKLNINEGDIQNLAIITAQLLNGLDGDQLKFGGKDE